MFIISYGVCPWQAFQGYAEYVPGLTHKHQTRLERPARDCHYTSCLQKFINYVCKKSFTTLALGPVHCKPEYLSLSPAKFHPSRLKFVGKARSIILEWSNGLHSGRLQPCSQILD